MEQNFTRLRGVGRNVAFSWCGYLQLDLMHSVHLAEGLSSEGSASSQTIANKNAPLTVKQLVLPATDQVKFVG
jgi:hypothetical protein